jgi:hypothetical protein
VSVRLRYCALERACVSDARGVAMAILSVSVVVVSFVLVPVVSCACSCGRRYISCSSGDRGSANACGTHAFFFVLPFLDMCSSFLVLFEQSNLRSCNTTISS